ncbi:hypothetical protein PHMEG_00011834 [Phytophthora megakarya]|uniref:Uncharacterized protein n=1 Tax=Phytophthora megakarya TaxID=4795 RepID=A0A225WC01_9STRA|nr:hypothetical protein PHMEG_00011834 [Phytophthora megakarya]
MLIFKNIKSNCPTHGLPGNVAGVSHSTFPSALIHNRLMTEWLHEPQLLGSSRAVCGKDEKALNWAKKRCCCAGWVGKDGLWRVEQLSKS